MNPLTAWKHHRDAERTREYHEREMDRLITEADRRRADRAAARGTASPDRSTSGTDAR